MLRRLARRAGILAAPTSCVILVGAVALPGCGETPPPVPNLGGASTTSANKTTDKSVKKLKNASFRENDEESNAERFARRAREAREKAGK